MRDIEPDKDSLQDAHKRLLDGISDRMDHPALVTKHDKMLLDIVVGLTAEMRYITAKVNDGSLRGMAKKIASELRAQEYERYKVLIQMNEANMKMGEALQEHIDGYNEAVSNGSVYDTPAPDLRRIYNDTLNEVASIG